MVACFMDFQAVELWTTLVELELEEDEDTNKNLVRQVRQEALDYCGATVLSMSVQEIHVCVCDHDQPGIRPGPLGVKVCVRIFPRDGMPEPFKGGWRCSRVAVTRGSVTPSVRHCFAIVGWHL